MRHANHRRALRPTSSPAIPGPRPRRRAPQWAEPVYGNLYVVRVLGGAARRAELVTAMEKAGVGALIHYPIRRRICSLPMPISARAKAATLWPEKLRRHGWLSLPMGPHVKLEQGRRGGAG